MHPKTSSSSVQQMVAVALIAAFLFSSAVAQTPAQPQATKGDQGLYRMRVESELVLVNVVARDKQGKPITDLKQGDFTLLEDGKAQKISSFDFENLDTTPLPASPGPSQQTASGPVTPAKPILTTKDADQALNNKRVIVLFFDLSAMGPDETERSIQAARKYVQTKMTAADLIAIVTLASSLRLDQDFTGDQARLLRVLNRFSHSEGQGMDNGSTGDADGIEESGNGYTPDETEYNQFNTDRKL
jgi:VWFA-related protein